MNSSTDFNIIYEGHSVQNHSMDVRDLAPALLSLGNLFDEANRILNGDKTSIKLQVKAHEVGSFEVHLTLYQSFAEQVSSFLTGDFVTAILNLKELILLPGAGLFWLIVKLKGKKPGKITDLKNGFVRLEFEDETFEAPLSLLRIYQDLNIRRAAEEILKPLRKEGIDSFKIKDQGKIAGTITKNELNYFSVPEVKEEEIVSSESEAAYSIISLTFKEDNKWRLSDGHSVINVVILDDDFKRKVDQNSISFSKGDILRCRIKTIQWRTANGLKTEYEVLEVKEHIPAARQLLLF